MEYYGMVSTVAIKHNCHAALGFGLSTNQIIMQQENHIELVINLRQTPVYINPRLVAAAGKAFYAHKRYGIHIQLHAATIDKADNIAEDFQDTFFHELAHLIAFKCNRHQGHGFPWA